MAERLFVLFIALDVPKLQNRGCKASRSPEDVWDSSLVCFLGSIQALHSFYIFTELGTF